jgi:hypothetical protein
MPDSQRRFRWEELSNMKTDSADDSHLGNKGAFSCLGRDRRKLRFKTRQSKAA